VLNQLQDLLDLVEQAEHSLEIHIESDDGEGESEDLGNHLLDEDLEVTLEGDDGREEGVRVDLNRLNDGN